MTEKARTKPPIRNMILTVIAVVIGLIWFVIAFPDRDWLWFLPVFNENAARIYLYRDGEMILLAPDDPGYEDVNEAINQILRHVRAKEPLGMSPTSQEEFYTQFSAVEAFYTEPVIIHTIQGFSQADKYLFPQSGRYFDPPTVFAGMQNRPDYREGALILRSRERLDEAVDAVWAEYER